MGGLRHRSRDAARLPGASAARQDDLLERADGRVRDATVRCGHARDRDGARRGGEEGCCDRRGRWGLGRGRGGNGESAYARLHGRRRVAGVPGGQGAARRGGAGGRVRPLLFAANWKMNLGPAEARSYLATFLKAYAPQPNRQAWFFPPAVSLEAVAMGLGNRADLLAGVQDIYWDAKGAFTGASSAPLAARAGAQRD